MKFINIYKKEQEINLNCMDKVILTQVVGVNNLSEEDFDNLADYFEEVTMVANYKELGKVATFEIVNKNEILQDCPLPDGTVVNDLDFEETTYIVAMGTKNDYGSGEITIAVNI